MTKSKKQKLLVIAIACVEQKRQTYLANVDVQFLGCDFYPDPTMLYNQLAEVIEFLEELKIKT